METLEAVMSIGKDHIPMGKENMGFVSLVSGGADSTCLTGFMLNHMEFDPDNYVPLHITYDKLRQKNEAVALESVHDKLGWPDVEWLSVDQHLFLDSTYDKSGYYPSRNILLLTMAAIKAEYLAKLRGFPFHVLVGILPDSVFYDAKIDTLASFADTIAPTGVKVFLPWVSLGIDKLDILCSLKAENLYHRQDYWSCTGFTTNSGTPCMECENCRIIKDVYGEEVYR